MTQTLGGLYDFRDCPSPGTSANFWHGKFQLQDFAQNYTTRNLSFFQSNLVSSSDSQAFPDKMT